MERNNKAYACINKNEKIRQRSSSGGMFGLFSQYILEHNGVVYGAAYTDDFQVIHKKAESYGEFENLIGSKYLQSNIGNIFLDVKREILKKRLILFVGTSCQIAGLKNYLNADYDNLICVDLICKSVSSPKIWKKYLETYFKKEKIQFVNFKDKTLGWNQFSVKIVTNQYKHLIRGRNNLYMQGFFKGLYNRPACSECKFRYPDRISDLTIADCWGIEEIAPEMFDNKGISCVIVNTLKGEKFFEKIKKGAEVREIGMESIIKNNPYLTKREKRHRLRSWFWFAFRYLPGKIVFSVFCYPYAEKLLNFLRNIKHKIVKERGK